MGIGKCVVSNGISEFPNSGGLVRGQQELLGWRKAVSLPYKPMERVRLKHLLSQECHLLGATQPKSHLFCVTSHPSASSSQPV